MENTQLWGECGDLCPARKKSLQRKSSHLILFACKYKSDHVFPCLIQYSLSLTMSNFKFLSFHNTVALLKRKPFHSSHSFILFELQSLRQTRDYGFFPCLPPFSLTAPHRWNWQLPHTCVMHSILLFKEASGESTPFQDLPIFAAILTTILLCCTYGFFGSRHTFELHFCNCHKRRSVCGFDTLRYRTRKCFRQGFLVPASTQKARACVGVCIIYLYQTKEIRNAQTTVVYHWCK